MDPTFDVVTNGTILTLIGTLGFVGRVVVLPAALFNLCYIASYIPKGQRMAFAAPILAATSIGGLGLYGIWRNVPRASLADGYAGILCVVLLEVLASAAAVAATVNKLGKVRRQNGSPKAVHSDVEGGNHCAGGEGAKTVTGHTSDKSQRFLDMESYRKTMGAPGAATFVRHLVPLAKSMEVTRRGRYLFGRARAYPGYSRPFFRVPWRKEPPTAPLPPLSPRQPSPSMQCTDITIDLLTQSEVCSKSQAISFFPEFAMDPVTTTAIQAGRLRLLKPVTCPEPVIDTLAKGKVSLDGCASSPPAVCRPNPMDVHVPLNPTHQQPFALQPLWREDPEGVVCVRTSTPVVGVLGPTHEEHSWRWPDSPMYAHAQSRLPKISTSVNLEGGKPRDGPENDGWVRPTVCCGRPRRVHVPTSPTAGVPACAQSGMQRQGTMDALLECTVNEVLSF